MTETLGDRIKKAREKRGWKQAELAAKAGVAYSNRISEWEGGKTPELDGLIGLIRALDVEAWWLLTGEPPMKRLPPHKRDVILDQLQRFLDEAENED